MVSITAPASRAPDAQQVTRRRAGVADITLNAIFRRQTFEINEVLTNQTSLTFDLDSDVAEGDTILLGGVEYTCGSFDRENFVKRCQLRTNDGDS